MNFIATKTNIVTTEVEKITKRMFYLTKTSSSPFVNSQKIIRKAYGSVLYMGLSDGSRLVLFGFF